MTTSIKEYHANRDRNPNKVGSMLLNQGRLCFFLGLFHLLLLADAHSFVVCPSYSRMPPIESGGFSSYNGALRMFYLDHAYAYMCIHVYIYMYTCICTCMYTYIDIDRDIDIAIDMSRITAIDIDVNTNDGI